MTPVAVLLAVAVAAGPSGQPKRTGLDISNAARAKAGLLPRKPARPRARVSGYATVRAPAPTYLPEPAPLAEDGPAVDGDADASPDVATAEGDASVPALPELVVARTPVETRRLPDAADSGGDIPQPEPLVAPDEIGAMRADASGVETEVTITMRFEP